MSANNPLVKVEIEGNKIVANFACTSCETATSVPPSEPCAFNVCTNKEPRIGKCTPSNSCGNKTTTHGCRYYPNLYVYLPCDSSEFGCQICKTGSTCEGNCDPCTMGYNDGNYSGLCCKKE